MISNSIYFNRNRSWVSWWPAFGDWLFSWMYE